MQNPLLTTTILAALLGSGFGDRLSAQIQPPAKQRHRLDYDSRALDNSSSRSRVVFEQVVRIPGAAWLRLFFDRSSLPAGSRLLITGLHHGWTQHLDAASLVDYSQASCFFRGEAIRVRLEAGARTSGNRIGIFAADAGTTMNRRESICDSVDHRVRSFDPRLGRLSGGCTGFLIGCDIMLTAGHCFASSKAQILHFNTGLSSPTGHPADAHPRDQYATLPTSVKLLDSGIGADWAICRLAKNSSTGKFAGQTQGAWFKLGSVPSSTAGQRIGITGYGVTSPLGVLSQVQKTHVGPMFSVNATTIRYRTDTTGGNSGSPIVHGNTGRVIGIHTHAGCAASPTSSNAGTRIDRGDLKTAIAALKASSCPTCDPTRHSYFIPDSSSTLGSCNVIPFGTIASQATWDDQKYQALLTTADLCRTSGCISDLAFVACSRGIRHFDRIVIRLAQTTATQLSTTFASNMQSNVQTVLDARGYDWHQRDNRWSRIGFDHSYCFDPTKGGRNVVVEITLQGSDFRGSGGAGCRLGNRQRIYATNWSGTPPTTGISQTGALKMEVLFDAQDLQRFGYGCQGSNKQTPALTFSGSAEIGGKGAAVHLAKALPKAVTFLCIGLPRLTPPLDLTAFGGPGCLLYQPNTLLLTLGCDLNGEASLPLTIPTTVPAGLRLWFQWLPLDSAANQLGLTTSNAGRLMTGF